MALNLNQLSLRTKLVALIAILLALVSLFLWLYFPARMESFSRRWIERRGVGMAIVLSNSVSSGVEFDDANAVRDMLNGLSSAPEVLYGVVRRANGTSLASFKGESAPSIAITATNAPTIVYDGNQMRVDAPIHARGGPSTRAKPIAVRSFRTNGRPENTRAERAHRMHSASARSAP